MRHLHRYPGSVRAAIYSFEPAISAWAAATPCEMDEVRQEIVIAVLSGKNPAVEVPKALGIRQIGGVWRSTDACAMARADEDFLGEVPSEQEVEPAKDNSGIAVALYGGTTAVAVRCSIGLRAAQMWVKAQASRFEENGDLFSQSEVPQ